VVFEPGGTPPQTSAIRITTLRTDPMLGQGTGPGTVKDDLTVRDAARAGTDLRAARRRAGPTGGSAAC